MSARDARAGLRDRVANTMRLVGAALAGAVLTSAAAMDTLHATGWLQ